MNHLVKTNFKKKSLKGGNASARPGPFHEEKNHNKKILKKVAMLSHNNIVFAYLQMPSLTSLTRAGLNKY